MASPFVKQKRLSCKTCTLFGMWFLRYQDRDLEVRTELARSMRKDRSLNILLYEKQTRLINSLLMAKG